VPKVYPPQIDLDRLYYEQYIERPEPDTGPINFYRLTPHELIGDLIELDRDGQVIRGGLENVIKDDYVTYH
jgi:hypothetical protein